MSGKIVNPLQGAKTILLAVEDAAVLGELVNQLVRIEKLKGGDGAELTTDQKLALVSHHQAEALGALSRSAVDTIAAARSADVAITALHHASTISKAAVRIKIISSPLVELDGGIRCKKFVRDFLSELAGLQVVAREALELYGSEASA